MVLEIDRACRLCLDLSSEPLDIDGNSTGHPATLDENLISKIFECTSLKVTVGDGLPESICEPCIRLVDKFFLFRKMCWEVEDKLKQYLFSEKDDSERLVVPDPIRLDADQLDTPIGSKDSWMCDSTQIKGEQETTDDDIGIGNDDDDDSDEDYFPSGARSTFKSHYNCDMCDESFLRLSDLKNHKKEEHPTTKKSKPVLICSFCKKTFKQMKRFKDHLKSHADLEEEKEDVINVKSVNDSDSDSQLQPIQVVIKNEADDESNQSRPAGGGESTGVKKKRGRKQYNCEYCDQVFHSHAKYTQHEITHTGEKKYSCSDCSRSFTHKHSLVGHIKEQHTGEVNFTCDVCGRGFVHQSTFNIHKKTHSSDKPLKCPDCGKCFSQMKNLRVHRQIHTASRSHTCQVCGKSFNFLKTLKVHLVLHSGEKPYVCTYCGKAFAQSAPLKTHTRIHTGEKPYKCTICPLSFSTNNAVKIHILKHSGEAPFSCSVCGKGFNRKKDMVAHQEETHDVFVGLPSETIQQQSDVNSMLSQNDLQNTVMSPQQNCMQMTETTLVPIPSMIIVPDLPTDHISSHHSPPAQMPHSITPQHHHPLMTHHTSAQLIPMSHHTSSHLAPPTNCMPHPSVLYNNPPV